jgi:hypothetical protein
MKTRAGQQRAVKLPLTLALAASLLLASNPLAYAQETAVSEHFRIDGGLSLAFGKSRSESFRLSACMCEGIGGFSASASFQVLAGCVAFVPAERQRRPKPDPKAWRLPYVDAAASPAGPGATGTAGIPADFTAALAPVRTPGGEK